MTTLLFIYGTRPEAIKLAPVVLRCREAAWAKPTVCVTAQHRELLDDVNELFEIRPDRDLGLMRDQQTLAGFASRALAAVSEVIHDVGPAALLVQGDTTTAMMAALAAFYLRVPVAHVEAGLRTHDLNAPFPEEMNRQVIARLARWHFAPTGRAREDLVREGVGLNRIEVTGNTAIDALQWVLRSTRLAPDPMRPLDLPGLQNHERLVLVTAHRRENFGAPLLAICRALRQIVEEHQSLRVVFPVHPNPNVVKAVAAELAGHPNIHLVRPLDYGSFVALLRDAWLILTDSGGIQEEAPTLAKPVLVLRETTERPEAVAAGGARLVGTDSATIAGAVRELLASPAAYAAMAVPRQLFGDGHAAERILDRLARDLSLSSSPSDAQDHPSRAS